MSATIAVLSIYTHRRACSCWGKCERVCRSGGEWWNRAESGEVEVTGLAVKMRCIVQGAWWLLGSDGGTWGSSEKWKRVAGVRGIVVLQAGGKNW
nr:hypothetical protein [Tanacetum cinerariifolium]